MPAHEFGDSIIHYLNSKHNVAPDKMLLGASTCVDDIIYTIITVTLLTISIHYNLIDKQILIVTRANRKTFNGLITDNNVICLRLSFI